ncbi:MlaD family protein [Chitinophagaceae bacterium LB-8]|uniref:MlaD family protein n=1 Tax=Paraflavisolibacter caeni TaxID=2982496 RepID=A0A9X2XXB3_9BACT|nr:MlaD family protein [Paraflavisolibacter caeni]MCU7550262.1 MlaD family protein [Paraflavisolibacter caeni]
MKISNEAKVGILAAFAILILVIGFNFLKGKQIFSRKPTIYAVFPNIGTLEKSNSVTINGLPVGTVYDFKPADKEVNNIIVEIQLTRDVLIPNNSVAFIDASLVGSAHIALEKGNSNIYLKPGDTISTRLDAGLLGNLRTQLTPTLTRVNETVDSLKFVLGSIHSIFDPSTNANLQSMIAHLTLSSAHLSKLLNTETGMVAQVTGNLNSVTGNLARNNEQISASIRNIEVATSNLANAPIPQTITSLQNTIEELRGTVARLDKNLNNNNGTLGKLMNDQKLYEQMNQAVLSLEILLDDIRVHPKRYVNISVFGGKNKSEPLTSPSTKDTVVVTLGKQ